MYYFRRKAYDSGILYFKNVLTKYADVAQARDAALRLVESYKANRYQGRRVRAVRAAAAAVSEGRDVRERCARGSADAPPAAKADSARVGCRRKPPPAP